MTTIAPAPTPTTRDALEGVVHLVCACELDDERRPLDPRGPLALCGVRCDGHYRRRVPSTSTCPMCYDVAYHAGPCPACKGTPR